MIHFDTSLSQAVTFCRMYYSTTVNIQGENGVGKLTDLQQEDFLSHLRARVGMRGENACGFGFLPKTSLGHQYHLMNHLGWLQVRADGFLMAPH